MFEGEVKMALKLNDWHCSYVLVVLLLLCASTIGKNNICKNFMDYYMNMDNNPNCWYNPELEMNSTQILTHRGYTYEQYEVETEDGYILSTFRLPQGEGKKRKAVIVLEPPMSSSSDAFLDIGNDSFAYVLWHLGYEVWLGNYRGTIYGRKHKKYNPDKDKEFWEKITLHELGAYDMAATVEFASKISGDVNITMLGFSMGGTAGLIYASSRPDHTKKYCKAIILWAPSSNMVHTRELTKQAYGFTTFLELLGSQGVGDITPHKFFFDVLSICRRPPVMFLCLSILIYFENLENVNDLRADWFPITLGHNPGGIPYRVVIHYLQLAKDGEFRQFDYGKENLKHYNSTKPPFYPIEEIQTPILLVYGTRDLEATEIDVLAMYDRFPKEARIYKPIRLAGMHHTGFVYSPTAPAMAYPPTLEFLDKLYSE